MLAEVAVDVVRRHGADLAGLVLIAEQVLARQVLTAPDDPSEGRILDAHVELVGDLAAESQLDRRAAHRHMARAQRGDAERAVGAHVLVVAHAQPGEVEQPHDDRDQAVVPEAARGEVAPDVPTQRPEVLGEGDEVVELVRRPLGGVLGW